MRAFPIVIVLGACGVLAAGCGNTGLGSAVRQDVSARMETTKSPIASCYEKALKTDRKLRGTMELSLIAEAKTGNFTNIRVVRNDLPNADLEACVVAEVGKLKLEKPTKSKVAIRYPIAFLPDDLAQGAPR